MSSIAGASKSLVPMGWCTAFVDRWRIGRWLHEFMALEPLNGKAVLHDAGLAGSDLAKAARAVHVHALLPAALALHGVDGTALEAERADVMRDLVRVCMHCRSARACARTLTGDIDRAEHAGLCPNVLTLDMLSKPDGG
ncbi:hypothetical protein M5E06_13895 [Azospirillum sp. A1-3]|uniref:hypothetical protein n=1 Tax=Azospirillum sp. A1-3 TaxID=185874 RepID=UPI002076D85E|nr:hypothetical protein [Azospirillum sp. A1-3]MCM8735270.1 hypothetical protein [Azospirillum sp. A1-3]